VSASVSSGVIIFLELTLVLGLALVVGVRELRNLRRYDRERAERARAAEAEAAAVQGGSQTNPGDAGESHRA
jgi:Tfp pilus assembly protein PilX